MKEILNFVMVLVAIIKPFNGKSSIFIGKPGYVNNLNTDTVKKDIPLDQKGNPMGFYKWKDIIEKKGDFQTIENGFDSLEIRIWYGHAFSDKLQLLVISKWKLGWNGELVELNCVYDKKHDSILSISRLSKKVLPKTGWKDFILKINKLKVQSLPNYSTINNYSVCSDGDGVTIEVATVNKYRIYNYPCFESNAQIWQAGNISKIMNLIENEFNFKRLRVK